MDSELAPKPRPYWHVDAKWITGLLLTFVLGLTLLVYTLIQVTAEKPAIDTVSMTLALAFSPQGLDDETEIAAFRQQLRASPDGRLQPIAGLRIIIHEQDIAHLTPRQARLYLFRQLAEPLYKRGPQGLTALADNPETRESMAQGIGPLSLFTLATHQQLQRVLVALGIVSVVLLILLILFSYRWGRLGSPGCVLFVVSLPCAMLFTFIGSALQPVTTPPAAESGASGMIGYVAANVLPPLAQIMSQGYVIALMLGLVLILLSVLGSFVWRLARKGRSV